MPSKKHEPEEIIGKLLEVEIMLGQGGTAADACRRVAVGEQTPAFAGAGSIIAGASSAFWPSSARRAGKVLALVVARQLRHEDVLAALTELFIGRGGAGAYQVGQWQRVHRYRGSEMAWAGPREGALHRTRLAAGERLQQRLQWPVARPVAQWRDLLQPAETKVLIEAWGRYNTVRPHSSLGYRPPTPKAATPPLPASGSASLHLRTAMAAETTVH
jgi:hypothetical protein